ncbi:hypothetical protein [Williamsia sterculiae]|uniref:Diacylglycerol O-acyltransferase n=1 Tax=Williamsia sterculiae TaxID=1344003 RepID=A0A1N7DHZ8_9NOCA|nr:hypothetical protein [Williamsia sterculiae]SIR75397.1 hypothetical protein SAMN05445060_0646 [Williamsia sterculiae]
MTGVRRLGVVDEIFYREHTGGGTPVVMQGLARVPHRVTPEDLADAYASLAGGPLSSGISRSRVPLARNWFHRDVIVSPLLVDDVANVVTWADDCARTPLDVEKGPVWELRIGHVAGGGSILSLVCAHAVADGMSMLAAAADALTSETRAPAIRTPTAGDDLRDAVTLARLVVGGVTRTARQLIRAPRAQRTQLVAEMRASRGSTQTAGNTTAVDPTWREATTVIDIDAVAWDRATGAGSDADLAVVLIADLVTRVRGEPGPLDVFVPRVARAGGVGANAVSTDAVRLRGPEDWADPTAVHGCMLAGQSVGAPADVPPEILQLIGPRLSRRLVPEPGAADAMVSILGDVPAGLSSLGADGVAVRAMRPSSTPAHASARRTTADMWLIRSADTVTLSVVAPDVTIRDRGVLDGLLAGVCAARGLTVRRW